MIALVLFDLDGTLVETAPEIRDALSDTLRLLGLPPASLANVEQWIGQGAGVLLRRALEDAGALQLLRDAQPLFDLHYTRRCGTNSRLVPGAQELLQALRACGIHRALVTNKEQRFAMPLLARHGLLPLLERVVCGDLQARRKPDPAGVFDCLHGFKVDAHRAVFVGDSAIDVQTARHAGVRAWALAAGYNGGEPIVTAGPDRLFHALADVLREACGASA